MIKQRWSSYSFPVTRRYARERMTADHYDEINNKKCGLTLNKLNFYTIFRKSSDLLHRLVDHASKLE